MRRNIRRLAKDVDHVDVTGNRRDGAINFFAEHFRRIGIVDGDRHYLQACALRVLRYEESRSMFSSLDAEHGDASCIGKNTAYAIP